jgi:hypothetical protein
VQADQDAFETIGDFNRHGVERYTSYLLEVCELRDLLPIEPDLPAKPPGRDGRLLPVILHKADIMLARVDADSLERLKVDLLRVPRVGLEDDLELGMLLEAIGVLAVAPVVGTDRRFDICHVPWLGTEHAQKGGGVHRPCANLGVIRLPEHAAALCPKLLEGENDLLEVERHGGW